MKRINYFLVALISCAMLFVACDNQNPTGGGISNKDKENATKLVEIYDAYFSHLYVDGVSNDYWVSFLSEGLELVDGYPEGSGDFVYIEIFPEELVNNFPVGEYAFAEDPQDGCAWAGWEYDVSLPQGSYIYVVEDGKPVETKYIVSGKVIVCGTVSAAEFFVDATFDDGTKATYYYEGKLRFDDYDELYGENGGDAGDNGEYNFDFEPMIADEYDVTFDVCQVFNNGNVYNTASDYVELYLNGIEWMAYFDLFAPLNSGADVYGTYNIVSGQYDEWCGVPSSGGNDYGDTPSFFGTDFTEDGYYSAAYYVVSGTVVIAEDGVDVDITTYNGSKIKASYDGDVVVETTGVQMAKSLGSAQRKANRVKLVKTSTEDVVYFGTLKNRVRK